MSANPNGFVDPANSLEYQINNLKAKIEIDPSDVNSLNQLGLLYLEVGMLEESLKSLEIADSISPNNSKIYFNIGNTYLIGNKPLEAIKYYEKAIEIEPNFINAYNNLGNAYLSLNDLSNAIQNYQSAVAIDENNKESSEPYNNLGNIHLEHNEFEKAKEYFINAIRVNPEFLKAKINLANTLRLNGEFDEAIKLLESAKNEHGFNIDIIKHLAKNYTEKKEFEKAQDILNDAIENQPQSESLLTMLGLHFKERGNSSKANECFNKVLIKNPNSIPILNMKGLEAYNEGNFEKAKEYFERVVTIDPSSSVAYSNLGGIAQEQGNIDGSIICNEIALSLNPTDPLIYHNLGSAYLAAGRLKEAGETFTKALELVPDDPDLLRCVASVYRKSGQRDMAKKFDRKSIQELINQYNEGDPNNPQIFFTSAQAKALAQYALKCKDDFDWENFNQIDKILEIIVNDQLEQNVEVGVTPFISQYTMDATKFQRKICENIANFYKAPSSQQFKDYKCHENKKLRIGYISPDFSEHIVGFLIDSLFSLHDRNKFEIYCYSIRESFDQHRTIIKNSCDSFIELSNMSHYEAALKIHNDNINILVDLAGYTTDSRPRILGFKPAPVQCHFLGQTGTMGADYIQYHLNTKAGIPESMLKDYSEQIVYLPETQIATKRFNVPAPPEKSSYNLPEDKFIFCCFNGTYRIDLETFKAWAKILEQTPNSVLWIKHDSLEAKSNIENMLTSLGIGKDRIIFKSLSKLSNDWPHQLADLYLDSFMASGFSTGILSTYANLPVLTFAGKTPASRSGASILSAVNMPELITENVDDYINLAIKLATDKKYLTKIKEKLAKNVKTSTLFNADRYIKQLENAYLSIWDDHLNGHKNKTLCIESKAD